ncbi:hypothetical protein ES707_08072 [subsurface metagenome]
MGVINEWTEEIYKLKLQNDHCGKLIKVLGEKNKVLRKKLAKQGDSVIALMADVEQLEKDKLRLENNIRIIQLP